MIKDSTGFTFYTDSAQHDYTIQFWPKGRFTFTAENGFSGEADSILIKGSSREQVGYSRMVRLQEKDQGSVKEKLRVSNRAIHKQAHIVKTNSDWGKWVGGGLILIALLDYYYIFLKKRCETSQCFFIGFTLDLPHTVKIQRLKSVTLITKR